MKNIPGRFLLITSVALLVGCVPITYTKTVTTHQDGSGKVTGVTIVETITEPHSETARIKAPESGSVLLKNIEK